MPEQALSASQLRYIDASHVQSSVGHFDRLEVRTVTGNKLGDLDGIIVDPPARRLCYFVVDSRRWLAHHRYLVPLCPARIDTDRHTLRVDLDEDTAAECVEFDPAAFPQFSDDDLIRAMFKDASPTG